MILMQCDVYHLFMHDFTSICCALMLFAAFMDAFISFCRCMHYAMIMTNKSILCLCKMYLCEWMIYDDVFMMMICDMKCNV